MAKTDKPVIISAKDIHKTYGSKSTAYEALRGISLDIKRGESLAISGKSGSGKSTLMHLLAGLDHPTKGSITWDNQSLTGLSEKQLANLRNRHVGFVFQQFFLQPSMTVLENSVLPLKIAGVPVKQRNQQALQSLKAVGLLDKADNRATELSGGQRQRVAIARALINQPTVIFADEPTGNLDTETGQQVVELLFDLQKKRGITLVIVTHDTELSRRCNRMVHIKDGRLA